MAVTFLCIVLCSFDIVSNGKKNAQREASTKMEDDALDYTKVQLVVYCEPQQWL